MAFRIIRNDITKVAADAIVNTANPKPRFGSGTDFAIYMAAGAEELLKERQKIGNMEVGQAAATPAFALDAKYIIHTVGPAWIDGEHGEREAVRACYVNSLQLAKELGCESIAFPLIATGIYGFPKADALQIAVSVFSEFLSETDMQITLVVFDETSFVLSGKIFSGVDAYIDRNYVSDKIDKEYGASISIPTGMTHGAYHSVSFDRREDRPLASAAEPKAKPSLFDKLRRRRHDDKLVEINPASVFKADEIHSKEEFFYEEDQEHLTEGDMDVEAPGSEADSLPAPGSEADILPAPESEADILPESEADSLPESYQNAAFLNCQQTIPDHVGLLGVQPAAAAKPGRTLDELMAHVGDTWQQSLFRLIDEKGYTDTEVYKRANVDRKLFSKIRSNENYQPKKITAVSFALALHLSLDETKDLLGRAGYALSPSSKFDLIIQYFIENEVYDSYTINLALFEHKQPLLGE